MLGGFRYGGHLQYPGNAQTSFGFTAQNPTGDYSNAADRPGFATSPSAAFLAGTTSIKFFWVAVFALGPSGADLAVTPPIEFEPFLRVKANGVSWDSGTSSWHVFVDNTATGDMTEDAFDGGQVLITNDSESGNAQRVGTIVKNNTNQFFINDPLSSDSLHPAIQKYDFVLPSPTATASQYGCLGSLRINYDAMSSAGTDWDWQNFVSDGHGDIQSDAGMSNTVFGYNSSFQILECGMNNTMRTTTTVPWGTVSPIATGLRLSIDTMYSSGVSPATLDLGLDYPMMGPLVHITTVASSFDPQGITMTKYTLSQFKQIYFQTFGDEHASYQIAFHGWSE